MQIVCRFWADGRKILNKKAEKSVPLWQKGGYNSPRE
jgi:hypothetical protein